MGSLNEYNIEGKPIFRKCNRHLKKIVTLSVEMSPSDVKMRGVSALKVHEARE
jgi:hypothetical protein